MRKGVGFILLTWLLTLAVGSSLMGQISGTFTVGNGGDFSSLSQAIDSLSVAGLAGPVNLEIFPGRYFEQVHIPGLPGAGPGSPLSIYSQSGSAGDVIIEHASGDSAHNYLLKFDGASDVHLSQLTLAALGSELGRIIVFSGTCRRMSIRQCTLNGIRASSVSDKRAAIYADSLSQLDSADISQNQINAPSVGVFLHAPGIDNRISQNQFSQVGAGVHLAHQQYLLVEKNRVEATAGHGLSLARLSGSLMVQENKVVATATALKLNHCRPDSGNGKIANNFFISSDSDGVVSANSGDVEFVYNSINALSADPGRAALAIANGNSGWRVFNNVLSNSGAGLSYRVTDTSAIAVSDYNNLFTIGPFVAEWAGQLTDLPGLQLLSGNEPHSISADPQFFSSTDLHARAAEMEYAAFPLAHIQTDIDGEWRDISQPDIGADEYDLPLAIRREGGKNAPRGSFLASSYPNPFNSSTIIEFKIEAARHVALQVFDSAGKLIRTLIRKHLPPGRYSLRWDGTNFAGIPVGSGIYLCRLQAGDHFQHLQKLVLIR